MSKLTFAIPSVILALVAITGLMGLAQAASANNGNFETGNLSGWTVIDAGSGSWFVYSGTTAPFSGFPIPPPPEGSFAAIADQRGPGSHILYQDISLEPGFSHNLSLTIYYENRAGVFFSPPSLSHIGGATQQYRVDIMDPTAPANSVAAGDVLANIFRTNPGDPTSLAPMAINFDLSPFEGMSIRLRFALVDNIFFFQAGVDAVEIESIRNVLPIDIDIKPGSDPNSINRKSKGRIPVAILSASSTPLIIGATSTPPFIAPDEVDRSSLTFGRTGDEESLASLGYGAPNCSVEDVNGDGLPDLVCHFNTQEAGFQKGDTEGILRGRTFDGLLIEGRDAVRIVPTK